MILDSDDMITPDFISKHLQEFETHRDIDLVYCDDYLINENGQPIRIIKRPEYSDRKNLIRDLFKNGFPVVPFRTCIRKSVFDSIGYFDEQLKVGEDYDMMRRFVMYGLKAHHLKEALYLRRLTKSSLSRHASKIKAKSHFDVVRRYADTFTHEMLFPDMDWDKIEHEKRRLSAKCLVAKTFLTIGNDYIKADSSPVYAQEAFEHAGRELKECLKLDPNNIQIRQLVQKCETNMQRIKNAYAASLSLDEEKVLQA